MSISHRAQMIVDTRCTNGDPTPSLRMHDPGDFSQVAKFTGQEVTPEKTFS